MDAEEQQVYPASYVTIYATHNMFKRSPVPFSTRVSLFLPFLRCRNFQHSFLKKFRRRSLSSESTETCKSDSEVVSFAFHFHMNLPHFYYFHPLPAHTQTKLADLRQDLGLSEAACCMLCVASRNPTKPCTQPIFSQHNCQT